MAKKKKNRTVPLKARMKKMIQICGRKFRVVWGDGNIGAQFHTVHPETGGGVILLGDGPRDEFYQLSNLIHEVLEVVYTFNDIRVMETEGKIMFVMNHDQFTKACLDITRSLIETGLIQVNDEPGV